MDISLCFREFLLSILTFMSQLLPRSSHSPPAQPQPSQTTDPEATPVTPSPVVAEQNIKRQNPQWQGIVMGFCFTSALQIALQYMKTPSQLPLSFHLLSLTVVLTFSALFVAKLISSKYPVPAQVIDEIGVFFVNTAFFLAITIPMPLCLKFFTWAIYVVLFTVFLIIELFPRAGLIRFCLVGIPSFFGFCVTLLSKEKSLTCKVHLSVRSKSHVLHS